MSAIRVEKYNLIPFQIVKKFILMPMITVRLLFAYNGKTVFILKVLYLQ